LSLSHFSFLWLSSLSTDHNSTLHSGRPTPWVQWVCDSSSSNTVRFSLSLSVLCLLSTAIYVSLEKKKKGWNEESIRRMSNCDTLIDKQKTTRAGLKKFISNMVLQKICYLPHVLLTTWRHASERRSDTCIYYTWPHGHM